MNKKASILASMLAVIIIFLASCNSENKTENKLIGTWKLSDYQDNAQIPEAEQEAYKQSIEMMKRMILVINSDYSYSRSAGQQFELGTWQVNETGNTFTTTPKGGKATSLNIKYLDEKQLVFSIAEGTIITEITFLKQ